MYIANVITIDIDNSIPDYINVVRDKKDLIKGLPTLSIGWFKTKEIFNLINLDVGNKVINENTFWTFSKFEKRDVYVNDLNKFYKIAIDNLRKKIKYTFISLLKIKLKKIKSLLNFIDSNETKIIYIYKNRIIYIYNKNNIYGISLDEIEFIGLDKTKIINRLFINKEYNYRCEESELIIDNNDLISDLKNHIMLIPYIYCGEN
jgi:hypothetical protein